MSSQLTQILSIQITFYVDLQRVSAVRRNMSSQNTSLISDYLDREITLGRMRKSSSASTVHISPFQRKTSLESEI